VRECWTRSTCCSVKTVSPNNYDLNMGHTGGGGWRTPRHRHNFDQVRYVIKGRLPYSEDDFLEKAGSGTSPKASTTAPRNAPKAFAPGSPVRRRQRRRLPVRRPARSTNAELEKTGEFKQGLYHYTDANGDDPRK
jgi:hypothetical protein